MHIPASPFPRRARGGWCKGTPESGAEDGLRTRGLDHGVVALCLLSYIRKLRGSLPASTGAASRHLVNEHRCACSVAARWPLPRRARRKQKGPDPSGIRASREEKSRKTRLHVFLSRKLAAIAITVHARLQPEALEPGCGRDRPGGHHGGRADEGIPARGAGRIRRKLLNRSHDVSLDSCVRRSIAESTKDANCKDS